MPSWVKLRPFSGKIQNLALLNHLAQCGHSVLNHLRIRGHLNFLALGTNHEMNRNSRGLIHVQSDAFLNVFLEALGLDLQLIVTDGQLQQEIGTVTVGGRDAR